MMLDQMFSSNNFRQIFEHENSKGLYLEGTFFPKVEIYSVKLKRIKQLFRRLKRKKDLKIISETIYINRKAYLNRLNEFYISKRDTQLTDDLGKLAVEVNSKRFKFDLKELDKISGKSIYSFTKNAASYFAGKQLQRNLKYVFKLNAQNRDYIIPQLKQLLADGFPKFIIRTDINSFYESIDGNILESKLYNTPLLNFTSKRLIKQILKSYWNLPNNPKGVPRGIGISAYLAELYLKEFDEKISLIPDLIYYARYVDDIVIVFSPKPTINVNRYKELIQGYLCDLCLTINNKTKEINLLTPAQQISFDYLGYKFNFKSNKATLSLKEVKLDKYKQKIDAIIADYKQNVLKNPLKHREMLIQRVRFLTGNTRLLNSKHNVMIGIYYSHKHIDDTSFLKALDCYLKAKISQDISDISLRNRLIKISFYKGFVKKTFRNFNTKQLSEITAVWKNV